MKKKIVIALLTTTMIATFLTGCGASEQANNNVVNTQEVSQELESSEAIDNTVEATTEQTVESEETEEPTTTEVQADEPTENAQATEVAESPKETEVAEVTVIESETVEETEVVEEQVEEVVQYTYTDLNKTMWVKSSVNVRDLPSTDGNKVASLKSGQEVEVTGQCNETGWYRLEDYRYVSNNYLVDTKPVAQAQAPVQSGTVVSAGTDTSGYVSNAATSQEAQLLAGFVDILNAKRAEAGLSQVSGSSSLDATALQGAKELATNYSHQVAGGGYDRVNIGKGFGSADAQAIFNAWWNSDGHRAQMMDSYLTTASAAYYDGYVIFIGNLNKEAYNNAVAEEIDQQMQNGELVQIGETQTDPETGASVTTYGTPGAVKTLEQAVADGDMTQEEADAANAWMDEITKQFTELKEQGYSDEEIADILNNQ